MTNSILKIQFYYEISIFSEKNANFCLQSKFMQAKSTSKTISILDLSILRIYFDFRSYRVDHEFMDDYTGSARSRVTSLYRPVA